MQPVEFLNLNEDPALDPEIKPVPLSRDGRAQPPSYCLPWVEATRYSIQIKANFEYWVRKSKGGIEACAVANGVPLPVQEISLQVPSGLSFVGKGEAEIQEGRVVVGTSPSFSSPWQSENAHSVTLKLGICWWTPPGWGLFFTSAVHRNERFRVVEGFVRTDLWHRDIPIVVQPLAEEVKIPKYSIVASALLVPAEEIELRPTKDEEKAKEVVQQISAKRINPGFYKILVGQDPKKTKPD